MTLPKEITQVFKQIKDPYLDKTYLELGWVRHVGGKIRLRLGYPLSAKGCASLQNQIHRHLVQAGIHEPLELSWKVSKHKLTSKLKPRPGISNIIAVGSGKGGVGKSTVAANLACALQAQGASVGLLDADIYGPSQPHVLGQQQKPEIKDKKFIPLTAHGVSFLSMGLLVDESNAMIWRGPMVSGALLQLFEDSLWPELDYLILDLPPGTGDIQLTMAQKLPVTGAVVVTTPQDLSLLDAKKAITMFNKVNIPVLGILENMSTFVCESCGHQTPLFGEHGGAHLAKNAQVPLLGQVPLARAIGEDTEQGRPTVVAAPDSAYAHCFNEVALKVGAQVAALPKDYQVAMKMSVETVA